LPAVDSNLLPFRTSTAYFQVRQGISPTFELIFPAFIVLEQAKIALNSVASGIISAFKKNWLEFFCSQQEYILRNALHSLLKIPDTTLLDLPQILVDQNFRQHIISSLKDSQLRAFWFKEFE
jgi:hypothetical protein